MKRLPIFVMLLIVFVGCNANENKEGRIRMLESQAEEMNERLQTLESKVEALDANAAVN